MAVAVDNAANGQTDSTVSTAYTVSGSDRVLYVLTCENGNTGVDAVSYNSVSLTKVHEKLNSSNQAVNVWRLIAPATGSNTLSITQGGGSHSIVWCAVSFTGAHQSAPEGTIVDTSANPGTGSSLSPSSTSDGFLVDMLCVRSDTVTATVGSGQTQRVNLRNADAPGVLGCASTEVGTGSSVTMDWTMSGSAPYAHVAVPVLAASAVVAGRNLTLMGVG